MRSRRIIAEGDSSRSTCTLTDSPEDRGVAVIDILRFEDGKAVEHWDVIQPIPETAANDNTTS